MATNYISKFTLSRVNAEAEGRVLKLIGCAQITTKALGRCHAVLALE
jgi:hypothetical protein